MPITITAQNTGLPASAFPSKAVIQTAYGYNVTSGTRVFPTRSTYEPVPGNLQCTITPTTVGNTMIINAHLAWGGWNNTSNDLSALFRVFKSINGGAFVSAGVYSNDVPPGASTNSGVATGVYKYNMGDTNSSWDSDNILIHETITSTLPTVYAIYWACGYEAGSRTIYWNRSVNSGNSYNPTHTCTITATEVNA
jgi:hypothetical protein